jgi:hypothetical protein
MLGVGMLTSHLALPTALILVNVVSRPSVDDGTTEEETAVKFDPSRSLRGRKFPMIFSRCNLSFCKILAQTCVFDEKGYGQSSVLILREGAAVLFFGG